MNGRVNRLNRVPPAAALALGALALVVTGCGSAVTDTSAPYFPKSKPVASVSSTAPEAATPRVSGPIAQGPVAHPDPSLTPGVVASTDANAVCALPHRVRAQLPSTIAKSVFAAYGYTYDRAQYQLDYLVPLELGGAPVPSNLWPVPVSGVGFHEKEQLNARLRTAVCEGATPLGKAQGDIAANWYSLWLQYGR